MCKPGTGMNGTLFIDIRSPLIAVPIVVTVLACVPTEAVSQGVGLPRYTTPIVGGTTSSSSSPTPSILNQDLNRPRFSTDPTGKPCITINALSENQKNNPALYTHILILRNGCARQLRLKVCYDKTEYCTTMTIDGYRREQKSLGIFPAKDFRFEYQEMVM